jgi:transposase-like protein
MRTSRSTEAQTSSILEQAEGGARVDDLAREHGICTQAIDN